MKITYCGRTLVLVAALTAAAIAMPHLTAASTPAESAPKARTASTTPAPDSPAHAAELPSLLEQLDRMGSLELDRSSAGLRTVAIPGGGIRMNLEGRFHEYVVATRGADGRFRLHCLSGLAAVRRHFLALPAARPAPATEE